MGGGGQHSTRMGNGTLHVWWQQRRSGRPACSPYLCEHVGILTPGLGKAEVTNLEGGGVCRVQQRVVELEVPMGHRVEMAVLDSAQELLQGSTPPQEAGTLLDNAT